MAPNRQWDRWQLWICLLLVAATLAVYGQVRGHEFLNYDDDEYVTEHPYVRQGLSPAGLRWALTGVHSATWHPLTTLSHQLDCSLFGLDAGAHLLINVALHIASTLLLFGVLAGMTGRRWPSAFAAACFALHPLHVESVAWVAERKDVLSGFFWMLTLWAYWAYTRRPSAARYALVGLSFGLGLTAKPMLVTLPFVLLLLDYWPLGRFGARPGESGRRRAALAIEKLPLLLLAAAVSAVTFAVQRGAGALGTTTAFPIGFRIENALVSYAAYLVKAVWPTGLAVFYPPRLPLPTWQPIAAVLLLAGLSIVALRHRRQRPYLLVGWGWYLGTLVPVIGLIKQGEQAMADRYTYLPLIGISLMLAWWVDDVTAARRDRARAAAIAAAAVLVAWGLTSWQQLHYWRDSEALFRHALAVTAENHVAHTNLGALLMRRGAIDEATAHFAEALRIRPTYAKAQINIGMALAARGELESAIAHYQEAVRLDPGSAMAHFNWGVALGQQGKADEAIKQYRAALALDRDYANARSNLGLALVAKGRTAEAITELEQTLRRRPDMTVAHTNLAIALEQAGRPEEALAHYFEAVRLDPRAPLARLNLGAALESRGRRAEAIAQYRAALALQPDLAPARAALQRAEAGAAIE